MSGAFALPLRVYIEDTDAGGIVYYVNYLKYMERARTEFMRDLGYAADVLCGGTMFVVREAALVYHAPARLDDELRVTAQPLHAAGASLRLAQDVLRGDELLVGGRIALAHVDRDSLRPRRMAPDMLATLRRACEPRGD